VKGDERMRGKRHTPEQIIVLLRQAEVELSSGCNIGQVCQKLAVCEQTFHRWRNQYGGMKSDEMKRLRDLAAENVRLKKIVADQALDIQMLKETARGNF
jgi:putative transposase